MQLLRDQRGVASVEGAVLAPILVLIFVGLVYLHRVYTAKLETGDRARACAWVYANGGCDDVPEECRLAEGGGGAQVLAPGEFADRMKGALGGIGDITIPDNLQDVGRSAAPLASFLTGLLALDDEFAMESGRAVVRPKLFGGQSVTVSSRYSVLCNEKPMTISGIMGALWKAMKGEG